MSLDEYRDEVLRKIGRNMLLFQQLEHLLKYIIANGNFSGYASSIKQEYGRHSSSVKRKTMGQLAGQYTEYFNPDHEKTSSRTENPAKPQISLNFHIDTDQNYYESKKEVMGQIASERNKLIHNLLPAFDPDSEESCMRLQKKLDRQCEKMRLEIKGVEAIARAIKDGREKIADFLRSDEGERRFDLYYRLSRIGFLLVDIAAQIKRTDGWASMATAGQLLKKRIPEEFARLKQENEYSSLKRIIEATGLFDIYEEKTGNGWPRILYRLHVT